VRADSLRLERKSLLLTQTKTFCCVVYCEEERSEDESMK